MEFTLITQLNHALLTQNMYPDFYTEFKNA